MSSNKKEIYNQKSKTGYFEYKNMAHEFRPYIMFTNQDNYKTDIVNTDRLGFRKTFYNDKLVGIDELQDLQLKKNILVGGSTAFSMGASSDKNSLHSRITSLGNFCYSLGIRGATSHQELLSFLKFKNFFSNVKNIIILSGINDIAICSSNNEMYYKDFGTIMGSQSISYNFLTQSSFFSENNSIIGRNNIIIGTYYLYNKYKFFRTLFNLFFSKLKAKQNIKIKEQLKIRYEDKIENLRNMIENDLHTWSIIQKHLNINVLYFFQPGLGWTGKNLTQYEKKILDFEHDRFKKNFYKDFTDKKIYVEQRNFISNV